MFEPVELCDLIVADLVEKFGDGSDADNHPFKSIERDYLPLTDLKVTDRPQVIVCPGNLRTSRPDRRRSLDLVADLAIQQKLSGTRKKDVDRGVVDGLLGKCGDVLDHLRDQTIQGPDGRSYIFQAAETEPLFDMDRLARREFLSIFGFEFKKTGR